MRRALTALVTAVVLSACYHATIETGPGPGGMVAQQGSAGQVVDIPWAHGFVFGLVPPSTVQAQQKCTNGVSKVETELSFLNMLASYVTFSLYTPMHIKVTCR